MTRSAIASPDCPVTLKEPSWNALVITFIWLARKPIPTRMSCLPRIMSKESEMEKTLVPPWKGANPRSPRPQYPPFNETADRPQLTQNLDDCDRPRGAPAKHLLLMFAPGMPGPMSADAQEPSPCDLITLKMRL